MARRGTTIALCVLVTLAWPRPGWLDEGLPTFASLEEGRRLLGSEDAFIRAMSPFDRAARVKSDQAVSPAQFLTFVQANVLPWEDGDKQSIEAAWRAIQPGLAKLAVAAPKSARLIKTSGAEEGGAAYTRGEGIVFPKRMLARSDRELQRLLAHELFHVVSRKDPPLRDRLYQAIGFHRCGDVEFPATLRPRKITNPDAPTNEHCIQVRIAGNSTWAVPILLSRSATYDVQRRGEFFEYLQLALLLVARDPQTGMARPLEDNQGPRLTAMQDVANFFEQVGRNTRYVSHPEEILADNFALLVLEARGVPSPEILEKIKSVLARGR